ncbi:MAG: peptidylprolyl isomerase [Planctomycetota bacterium]
MTSVPSTDERPEQTMGQAIGQATREPATETVPSSDSPWISPGSRLSGGVEVVTGGPAEPVVGVRPSGTIAYVDGKVGEINGRAVLAKSFLEGNNLVGALRQEAVQQIRRAGGVGEARAGWRRAAQRQISDTLAQLIEDELIYSERVAEVPDGGAGIRRVLNNVREILRRQSYGSLLSAEAWVRSQPNASASIEEFAEDLNRKQLIRSKVDERVTSRVAVSWREVENYYRRNEGEFAPPPTAVVRLMLVDGSASDGVAERLTGGEPFEEVAASEVNRFRRSDGGLWRGGAVEFEPPFETATVLADPALNAALVALVPGNWAGPIERTGSDDRASGDGSPDGSPRGGPVYFVFLESITNTARTLYEAQLTIENRIRGAKRQRGVERYIRSLLEASSVTRREVMSRRLVEYAESAVFDPIAAELAAFAP